MTKLSSLIEQEVEEEFERSLAGNAFRALLLEVNPSIQESIKQATLFFLEASLTRTVKKVLQEVRLEKRKYLTDKEVEILDEQGRIPKIIGDSASTSGWNSAVSDLESKIKLIEE